MPQSQSHSPDHESFRGDSADTSSAGSENISFVQMFHDATTGRGSDDSE